MKSKYVHGAAENAGYTNTLTNESPSSVDNIIVIDLTSDDNEDDVIVQECKLEEGSPNDVADTSTSDVVQRDVWETSRRRITLYQKITLFQKEWGHMRTQMVREGQHELHRLRKKMISRLSFASYLQR